MHGKEIFIKKLIQINKGTRTDRSRWLGMERNQPIKGNTKQKEKNLTRRTQ